jgi:mRNA interferase RelE/StbE
MLRINLSAQAEQFLLSLPAKQARQIVTKLDFLAENPLNTPTERLRGGQGERRLKAGEFRIIFEQENEDLFVLLIDRRNDDRIYRKFRRL